MNKEFKNINWIHVVAALVIGVILGFLAGQGGQSAISGVSTNNGNAISSSKASDARVGMNTLLREHAAVGGVMLIAMYDGRDVSEMDKLMMDNEAKLSKLVGQVYGPSSASKFTTLWTRHMDDYKKYTDAERNGDSAGMQAARDDLSTVSNNLGKLLASPSLNAESVSALFTQHVNGTLAIVDSHAAGDEAKQADLLKAGYDQAGEMAETLTAGIVKDHPNLFK